MNTIVIGEGCVSIPLAASREPLIRLIPPGDITWASGEIKRLYPEIIELVRSSAGKLNSHDALIALLSREEDISTLVSLDRDFDELPWLNRVHRTGQITDPSIAD